MSLVHEVQVGDDYQVIGRSAADEVHDALGELNREVMVRRVGNEAPRSLGPLSAVTLQHPSGKHEVVLLGTLHTIFSRPGTQNPLPAALQHVICGLQPRIIVAEVDTERAKSGEIFPQHLRSSVTLLAREAPTEPAAGISANDPLLAEASMELQGDQPSLELTRQAMLHLWEHSSDARLFENTFCLEAYEAQQRGDFADDLHATVEAAAKLQVPVLLGDLPQAQLMSPTGLDRTREAFAEHRSGMLRFLNSRDEYIKFEGAKRKLISETMAQRGGGDLDLFVRCTWLLEPLGAANERKRLALLERRDPYLASAFEEPALVEALAEGGLAVAVLGAGHVPGVAALLRAKGYKAIKEPSRGWPPGISSPATRSSDKALRARTFSKSRGWRASSGRRGHR